MSRAVPATPEQIGDGEDHLVDVHDPEVPGDQLWRCPRRDAPRGLPGVLGMGTRGVVIEWWLVDAQGELIEAFWEKAQASDHAV